MKLNPMEIKAKLEALEALLEEANGMDGDELEQDFKGLKKVTVASDSEKGLEKGLEKASEIVENPKNALDEDMMKMESEEDEMSLPEPKEGDENAEVEEDLKMPIKGSLKSKKPKLSFFE